MLSRTAHLKLKSLSPHWHTHWQFGASCCFLSAGGLVLPQNMVVGFSEKETGSTNHHIITATLLLYSLLCFSYRLESVGQKITDIRFKGMCTCSWEEYSIILGPCFETTNVAMFELAFFLL